MHIQTENHARVPFEIGERDVDARVRVGVREVRRRGEQREAAELGRRRRARSNPKSEPRLDEQHVHVAVVLLEAAEESVGTEDVGTESVGRV